MIIIVLIGCRDPETTVNHVNSTNAEAPAALHLKATQEAEPTKVAETLTSPVEPAVEIEPTMEIVPTPKKRVIATPAPRYLGYVSPEPGSSYTIAEYNELVSLSTDATDPSICFSIEPLWFMEPGDFPTMEQFLSWIYMTVDDVLISHYSGLRTTDSLGAEGYNRFTNELLWKAPDGSPYHLCYARGTKSGKTFSNYFCQKACGQVRELLLVV
ncbi:MAG: hypothetical protein GWN61_24300 [candidate division Zixibacteria bacterium]|nr:hypothetical protein [Phycisphaerae bacterium]NIV09211.1 hypothetical protein [candidate division Zixibacteria bacterium]NIW50089.1 hypothetical protein [Gammaproteobacteria bacterium]